MHCSSWSGASSLGAVIALVQLLRRGSQPHVASLGRIPGTNRFSDLARNPDNEAVPGISLTTFNGAMWPDELTSVRYLNTESAIMNAFMLEGESGVQLATQIAQVVGCCIFWALIFWLAFLSDPDSPNDERQPISTANSDKTNERASEGAQNNALMARASTHTNAEGDRHSGGDNRA
ncbi:MAG: hypothetical protein ACRD6N_05705 [Pyrinomonadaceae bacterium]